MGREIRRVPPNWEHPECTGFMKTGPQPMRDTEYAPHIEKWMDGYFLWKIGEHQHQKENPDHKGEYWDLVGCPPNPLYFRPKFKEEPTWYQVYENVTEGTPCTPPFETKEELVNYLVEHGETFGMGQKWDRKAAEQFVDDGWVPTAIFRMPKEATK